MFRAKTVLVIGAGASAEVGLPVGSELLEQIVKRTHITYDWRDLKSGDPEIVRALKLYLNEGNAVEELNGHINAAWQLSSSAQQALSIDNVIDALEDKRIELVGKLGIVRSILSAENKSHFFSPVGYQENTLQLHLFKPTWYNSLTQLLIENCKRSEIECIFNNIEIINFNYDRCLEHYLPISLANYYGLDVTQVQKIMPSLVVHRPYGAAGRLPWQVGEAPSIALGGGRPEELAAIAPQIRTFTERVEEGDELDAIRMSISNADRIVFIGFAFHRQNVELLSTRTQSHVEIVATAYNISKSDQEVIQEELLDAFQIKDPINGHHRIILADMKCNQFFKEYWRTLTADKPDWEPMQLS